MTRKTVPINLVTRYALFSFLLLLQINQVFAQEPLISVRAGIPVGATSNSGIAFGNGIYITTFSNGLVYQSTDGESWLKVTDPSIPTGSFNRIAFGAGRFVIVGGNGLILHSTDGINWSTATSGSTQSLREVRFINSAFFAVAANQLLTSADGINWSTLSINGASATDLIRNITYGNGMYVVVSARSGYGDLYVYSSATAAAGSWSTQNIGFATPNKVEYLKDRFYIFTSGGHMFTSANGTTWANTTASLKLTLPNGSIINIGSPNQTFNGIYDGSKVYLYGYSKYYESYGSVFSSTDGTNFVLEPLTAYIVAGGSAWLNNKYFQFGNEGIVSSADGVNYKYPGGNFSSLASSGTGNYVAAGAISSSGVIFSSSDFQNWTNRTPASLPAIYAVVWNGSKYIAAGKRTVVHSTDNGTTWNQLSAPSKEFLSMAYGGSRLVAGATNLDNSMGELVSSTDGISWTSVNTANNTYFKVKYVNNVFFAVGLDNTIYEGVVLYSDNGTTWTDITPSVGFPVYYFNDVLYDGTKYHLMGADANYEFFSTSSSTPTNAASWSGIGRVTNGPTLGGYWGEGAFGFVNGKFAGSLNDLDYFEPYTIYSLDGINWTSVEANVTGYITSAIADGGGIKMVGGGNIFITADFDLSTLPVHLTTFTATPRQGKVVLNWQTASETNSSSFTIEHSTDNIQWTPIGVVVAAGNSGTTRHYSHTHHKPSSGLNYYRLQQTDLDGTTGYSHVAKVRFDQAGKQIAMHPNPSYGQATLELPASSASIVAVYDIRGRQVYQKRHTGNRVLLSLHTLPKGLYHVVVEQDGRKFIEKLVRY